MLCTIINSASQMKKLRLREVLTFPESHSRQAPGQASLHTVFTARTHGIHQEWVHSARGPSGGFLASLPDLGRPCPSWGHGTGLVPVHLFPLPSVNLSQGKALSLTWSKATSKSEGRSASKNEESVALGA